MIVHGLCLYKTLTGACLHATTYTPDFGLASSAAQKNGGGHDASGAGAAALTANGGMALAAMLSALQMHAKQAITALDMNETTGLLDENAAEGERNAAATTSSSMPMVRWEASDAALHFAEDEQRGLAIALAVDASAVPESLGAKLAQQVLGALVEKYDKAQAKAKARADAEEAAGRALTPARAAAAVRIRGADKTLANVWRDLPAKLAASVGETAGAKWVYAASEGDVCATTAPASPPPRATPARARSAFLCACFGGGGASADSHIVAPPPPPPSAAAAHAPESALLWSLYRKPNLRALAAEILPHLDDGAERANVVAVQVDGEKALLLATSGFVVVVGGASNEPAADAGVRKILDAMRFAASNL